MEYEETLQRKAYLDARGCIVLSACPGSGKTTSIVKKLYRIGDYCAERYGDYSGFACLSFTNTAAEELSEKYLQMHGERLRYPNMVSTIDSFIMQNVVLPFWYLCEHCKTNPIVVNEDSVLEKIYFTYVWLTDHYEAYMAMPFRDYRKLFFLKNPAKVEKSLKGYKWDHNDITKSDEVDYCRKAFVYRLKKGYITSTDALWIACYILSKHSWVGEALVQRYPYVIVDEAQDNSEMQFAFFSLLRKAGLENLEYVGDICQSIYGFRDARPDLLEKVMKTDGWQVLPLSECRRSNQRIIDLYSKLKPTFVDNITSHNVVDQNVPIFVYKYDDSNMKDVVRHFHETCDKNHLQRRVVLSRGISMCKKVAGIRDKDFRYWKSPLPYMIIEAKFDFEANEMDNAFRKMRLVISEVIFSDVQYQEKKDFISEIEKDTTYNAKIFEFMELIPDFSLSFAEWTDQMESLLQSHWNLADKPKLEAKSRLKGYKMAEMAKKPVEQFHMSSNENSEFRKSIDTIHSVKGATMDAVLLFLSAYKKGNSLSLNDFPTRPITAMNESQRLIYVACSRASQFIALAVPTSVNDSVISKALKGVKYELKIINIQQELF